MKHEEELAFKRGFNNALLYLANIPGGPGIDLSRDAAFDGAEFYAHARQRGNDNQRSRWFEEMRLLPTIEELGKA